MLKKIILVLVAVLLVMTSLAAACAQPKPSPAPTPAPAPAPAATPTPTPTPTPEKPYYQGKTIVFVVGHPAAGGTDLFGRMVANFLGKYVPGNPTIVVQQMTTGGGLVAPNYVYGLPPDGLVAIVTSASTGLWALTRTKGVKFSYDNMPAVMISPASSVFFGYKSILPKAEDIVSAKDIIFGYQPMPTPYTMEWLLAKKIFGITSEKDVFAYGGSGDARRAFMTKEINVSSDSGLGYNSAIKPMVDKGEVTAVWAGGYVDPDGRFVRDPAVPNIPTIKELYEKIFGKSPSGPEWDAIVAERIFVRTLNKGILFPPGSDKYVAILREAAIKMVKDPDFDKAKAKLLGETEIYLGEDATKLQKAAAALVPKATRDWIRNWFKNDFGVELEP